MAPATNMQRYYKFNICYFYLTTAHACWCRQVILNQREGKFGLKTGVEGSRVLVTGVSRRGAAGRAGLRPGDQLITINGKTLTGLRSSEVQRIFRDCPPVGIKFTFRTRYKKCVHNTLGRLLFKTQRLLGRGCPTRRWGPPGVTIWLYSAFLFKNLCSK